MLKKNLDYIFMFFIFICLFSFIIFCITNVYKPLTEEEKQQLIEYRQSQPKQYYSDIEVQVIDIDTMFCGKYYYDVTITVYSQEYNITKTFNYKERLSIGRTTYDLDIGDTTKAQLYTLKIDKTGEIIKQDINKIYHQ